ncbi:MAG: hypothetical protein HRT89_02230 [Lentisphaeria bacterium]|nr:thiamine pyrophosphate-dependent enzyme [Lentisphaeria bacterium]NQZ66865.1 hypothetical protein [Lentisphaeria bacterium]
MSHLKHNIRSQQERNINLVGQSNYMRERIESSVLPLTIDIAEDRELSNDTLLGLQALDKEAARISISSLASLAKIGELDHLGGGLDLIPALNISLAISNYHGIEYTIENAHCSIGYFSLLAAYGFIQNDDVIEKFRRGLDIPGHVSWLPGGTQLNGGRLGVMIPVAVGQALGKKAFFGDNSFVVCHTGDAGWISGQALNGFNAADLHNAPITFVMHRNGIQLSGSNKAVMDKDPRPIIAAMGIEILEIKSLYDHRETYAAYRKAFELSQNGRPSLIYPMGEETTLQDLADKFNIASYVNEIAESNSVAMDQKIWLPGALMGYRDIVPMLECIFLVNELPGGEGHHDGHMKGRDEDDVHSNPMMSFTDEEQSALKALRSASPRKVVTEARPAPGSDNLILEDNAVAEIELPEAGTSTSARAGVQKAYELIAKTYPNNVYILSCDLDPSTKLDKAKSHLADDHKFELSIEEQVATMMANGLAMSGQPRTLNIFSTFAAFFEGIAREGFEMWRYQRNLNGVNEGLNVVMHMSHVGACTGRDHFAGWSLDWINLAIGYLPFLHRFYAPSDARSAFIAVRDQAAHYGAHIIGIPRDNLPILQKEDGSVLWKNTDAWEPVTVIRNNGSKKAILAFGAPAFLAIEAAEELENNVDVLIVNGLPFNEGQLDSLLDEYSDGIVTIEDGLIGDCMSGLRGFAALVATNATNRISLAHVGINDPRIAPAEGHDEVWEHFGLTKENLVSAVKSI